VFLDNNRECNNVAVVAEANAEVECRLVLRFQVRLVVQEEQETLRAHERMSRAVGDAVVLSACSLLDFDAASRWTADVSARRPTSFSGRDCSAQLKDVADKFNRLRVSGNPDSSLTNQLAVSQVADWSTVKSLKCLNLEWPT